MKCKYVPGTCRIPPSRISGSYSSHPYLNIHPNHEFPPPTLALPESSASSMLSFDPPTSKAPQQPNFNITELYNKRSYNQGLCTEVAQNDRAKLIPLSDLFYRASPLPYAPNTTVFDQFSTKSAPSEVPMASFNFANTPVTPLHTHRTPSWFRSAALFDVEDTLELNSSINLDSSQPDAETLTQSTQPTPKVKGKRDGVKGKKQVRWLP